MNIDYREEFENTICSDDEICEIIKNQEKLIYFPTDGGNTNKKIYQKFIIDAELMHIKPDPLKFVFLGFREQTVGILASAGGGGKSYLSLAFILNYADTTKRLNYLDLFSKNRGNAGFITLEDDAELIHHRLYNLKLFFNIEKNSEINKNIEIISLYGQNFRLADKKNNGQIYINDESVNLLYEFCNGKKFVVLDTLRRLSTLDENNSSDMRALIQIIENVSYKTKCSILINAHMNKSNSNDNKDKVRGNSNITDDTRFTIILKNETLPKKEAEQKKINNLLFLRWAKVNAVKIPEPIPLVWREWIDEETRDVYSMLDNFNKKEETAKTNETEKTINKEDDGWIDD